MNYLVSDIETASIPGGELQSFAMTHFDHAPAPTLNVQVFENLMAADSVVATSARHLEQVMDAVPQHMFILEPDATLSFVNRAAREYLGRIDAITPTERLGAIIHPEDVEALLGAYRDAIAHGIPVEAEARVRSK
ncbi:MAG: PAS domain-containing protein, partial [Terriglobales bacterium]